MIEAQSDDRTGNTIRLSVDAIDNCGNINVSGTVSSSKGGTPGLSANDITMKDGSRLNARGLAGGGSILGRRWMARLQQHSASSARRHCQKRDTRHLCNG